MPQTQIRQGFQGIDKKHTIDAKLLILDDLQVTLRSLMAF